MADTPPALTPDEASALEAIGGMPANTPAADPPPAEFVIEHAPEPIHTDEEHAHEHGNEGGALHSGHADTHHAHDEAAHHPPKEDAEMAEMKSTMLDSAELANRAAGMAAKAAGDMHKASTELIESGSGQKIYLIIVLAVFGLLIVMAISIFAFMSFRLNQRVAQADAMLLAVGKRVIAMDESLEMFTGHGEALREVASKQDAIISAQTKIELRLDEVMRGVQMAADSIAKPAAGSDKDPLGWQPRSCAGGPRCRAQRSRSLGTPTQGCRSERQTARRRRSAGSSPQATGKASGKTNSVPAGSKSRENARRAVKPRLGAQQRVRAGKKHWAEASLLGRPALNALA